MFPSFHLALFFVTVRIIVFGSPLAVEAAHGALAIGHVWSKSPILSAHLFWSPLFSAVESPQSRHLMVTLHRLTHVGTGSGLEVSQCKEVSRLEHGSRARLACMKDIRSVHGSQASADTHSGVVWSIGSHQIGTRILRKLGGWSTCH